MRRIRIIGVLLGAMSLLVGVGCGDDGDGDDASATRDTAEPAQEEASGGDEDESDDDGGSEGSAPEACLLELAEVIEVTGRDNMVEMDQALVGSGCGFEVPLDPNAGLDNPENAGDQVFYRLTSAGAVEAFAMEGERLSGLGDEAAFDELSGGLVVRSGDVNFEIQVLISEFTEAEAIAIELAEIVLSKL